MNWHPQSETLNHALWTERGSFPASVLNFRGAIQTVGVISEVLCLLRFLITLYLDWDSGHWRTRLKFGPHYRKPWMVGGNQMQKNRCHSSLWATSGIHSRSAARTALLYPLFWTVAVMALFSTTSLTYLQSSFMEDSGGTSALWGNTQLFLLRSPHFDFAHITNLSLQTCSGQQEVSWKLKQLVELFLTTSSESIQ